MIRRTALGVISLLTTLLLVGTAYGQNGDGPQRPVIVEIFGCTYTANSDMSDLMAVADNWNEWADEQGVTDYSANILTPYLYSTAFPYDVVWLGVYPNAEAMGAGVANYLSEGREIDAEFGEVVDCSTHVQFAGLATHVPANPPDEDDSAVALTGFQDCSLRNERTIPEALAAHRQWGDYLAENGSDTFMGALVPIAGEDPSADYSYKAVSAFSSAEAYGQFLSTVVPGGLQRAGQLFGSVTDCDTSRLYVSTEVRAAAGNDE